MMFIKLTFQLFSNTSPITNTAIAVIKLFAFLLPFLAYSSETRAYKNMKTKTASFKENLYNKHGQVDSF